MNYDVINTKNLNRTIWKMSLPIMLQMLLQSLLGFIDMGMTGRLGSETIAGISIANTVTISLIIIGNAFSISGQVLVTRYVGAKEVEKTKLSMGQNIVISLIVSIIIFIIFKIWGMGILIFMGAEGNALKISYDYLRVINYSIPATMISTMLFSFSRGMGNTKMPFYISVVMNILHFILNVFLIFEAQKYSIFGFQFQIPGMGLKAVGAAIATSISNVASIIMVIYYYIIIQPLKLKIEHFKPNKDELKNVISLGGPAALEAFFVRFAFIIYTKIIMSLGTVSMAAHSVANTAESISFMPGYAFGTVVITFVGQFLGAKQIDKAKESMMRIDKISMLAMGTFGFIFVIYPQIFIRLFSNEKQVIELASTVLRIEGLAQIFFSRFNIYGGVLKAFGETKKVLYVSIIGLWGIRIPLTLLFIKVFKMNLIGAWIPMFLDYVVKGIIVTLMVKKVDWLKYKSISHN